MPAGVEMTRRVPVGRIVAARDVAADEAQAQVDPVAADGEALGAAVGGRRYDVSDELQVRAGIGLGHCDDW